MGVLGDRSLLSRRNASKARPRKGPTATALQSAALGLLTHRGLSESLSRASMTSGVAEVPPSFCAKTRGWSRPISVSAPGPQSRVNVGKIGRCSIAMEFPSPVRADRSTPGPKATERAQLNADYLGLSALIDFRYECPVTVDADSSINDARAQMIRLGVDAMLVTENGLEKTSPRLVGLIAAADIEREHAHHVGRGRDFSNAICAGEVVTPWDDLPVMNYESLHTLPMHDLCEMFRHAGLKHLLFLEIYDDELLARGLLSRSTISKHLRRTGRDSR
jgi:hypothetical protein